MKFIALQSTYDSVELALFNNAQLESKQSISKFAASKELVLALDSLLASSLVEIKDLSFISINAGPGPFTTLRVVIATANGISFANGIPLVAVDGLEAFAQEYTDDAYPHTVILLNAFTNDVYYAIQSPGKPLKKNYENITTFLEKLKEKIKDPIRFLGNGATMHRALIEQTLGAQAIMPNPMPAYCSIEAIATLGLALWNKRENISQQVLPLYLKQHSAVMGK